MIGLALCIGLLLGIAFGAAGAWAWIESRRDREEDAPAGEGGGGPTVGVAAVSAVLAKTFDAEFARSIARSTPLLALLDGKAKVEWTPPSPVRDGAAEALRKLDADFGRTLYDREARAEDIVGLSFPRCWGDRVGEPAHDCGIMSCSRRVPGAPVYPPPWQDEDTRPDSGPAPNPALIDLHAKVEASLAGACKRDGCDDPQTGPCKAWNPPDLYADRRASGFRYRPGHAQFVRQTVGGLADEWCRDCEKHVSKHYGGTEYRCQPLGNPSPAGPAELDEYPDEPRGGFRPRENLAAKPCAKCGFPVGDHDPQLAGIVCPTPPEAA